MSTPTSNLVRFAEIKLRQRVRLLSDNGTPDSARVEPFILAKVEELKALPEQELSLHLLLELGPQDYHIC